jgi:phage N-6-adenine-methyltransferase
VTAIVTGASLNRGRSKQDYGTPWEFIRAVERRFGPLVADLACTRANAKAPTGFYFDAGFDALDRLWAETFPDGNLWLNPPFANIDPWAEKCAAESANRRGLILLLTPASIGTDWFARHVHRNAMVLGLAPRLTFEGTTDPYPKDLMLSVFGMGMSGFDCWRWK